MLEPTAEEKAQTASRFADFLSELAERIRSGETEITDVRCEYPADRYYSQDKWEYFRLHDMKIELKYFNKKHRQQETERLTRYLEEHPDANHYPTHPLSFYGQTRVLNKKEY